MTQPMSKGEMAVRLRGNLPSGMPSEFAYEPQSSAIGNGLYAGNNALASMCGASSDDNSRGYDVWQKWYEAGGLDVPVLTPGSDIDVTYRLTEYHFLNDPILTNRNTSSNDN